MASSTPGGDHGIRKTISQPSDDLAEIMTRRMIQRHPSNELWTGRTKRSYTSPLRPNSDDEDEDLLTVRFEVKERKRYRSRSAMKPNSLKDDAMVEMLKIDLENVADIDECEEPHLNTPASAGGHRRQKSTPGNIKRSETQGSMSTTTAHAPMLVRRLTELDLECPLALPHMKEEDFIFIRELGRGSMGVVYLARHEKTGLEYAIKSFYKYDLGEEEWRLLMREAKIMSKLDHRNLLKLHSVFESEEYVFLALDYMEGGELFDQIEDQSKISEEFARTVITDVLRGLEYLHSCGIAHRDLKPENILCSKKGRFVIADFGLTQFCGGGLIMRERCGTVGYSAPEVMLDKGEYTEKVDIYSLGVLTWVLLTGKFPPELEEDGSCLKGMKSTPFPKPVSRFARDFVWRCCSYDPEDRPSCLQLVRHPWIRRVEAPSPSSGTLYQVDKVKMTSPRSRSPVVTRRRNPLRRSMLRESKREGGEVVKVAQPTLSLSS